MGDFGKGASRKTYRFAVVVAGAVILPGQVAQVGYDRSCRGNALNQIML